MKNKDHPLFRVGSIRDLKALVNRASEKYGGPAFTYTSKNEQVTVSYLQFKTDVDAFGTSLLHQGVKNAEAAVVEENSYELIELICAIEERFELEIPDREISRPKTVGGLLGYIDVNE